MQPYFFPYLGYYQLVYSVDKFVLYDNLKYIKHGWVNRNRLLQVNRSPFFFRIPVPKKYLSKKKIRDIRIKDQSWRKWLIKSIIFNYKRSPYFEDVFPLLESIILSKTDFLSTLNKISITEIASYLGIDTDISTDPSFDDLESKLVEESSELSDIFPDIHLITPSVKLIRGIEICKSLKADTFINLIGGINLYPKEEFKRNGLDIFFLDMKEIRYRQNHKDFFPRLSIIDVLMNCGKKGTIDLLNEYVLI